MTDETPQPEPTPQVENTDRSSDPAIEHRSVEGTLLEAGIALIPVIPVAAQVGQKIWDGHKESQPDAPEIILPPGVEDD